MVPMKSAEHVSSLSKPCLCKAHSYPTGMATELNIYHHKRQVLANENLQRNLDYTLSI